MKKTIQGSKMLYSYLKVVAFYTLLISVSSFAAVDPQVPEAEPQTMDFTKKIKAARNEQQEWLRSFQAELKKEEENNGEISISEREEVIEFLHSEIRWKPAPQNAQNSNF